MNKKIIGIVVCLLLITTVLPVVGTMNIAKSNEKIVSAESNSDDWPMWRHDSTHLGYSTSTAPVTSNVIWSYTTAGGVVSSPSIVDGRVYFGSNDENVYCIDAEDGSYIWSYKTDSKVESSPAVVDGKVYVSSSGKSQKNNVYCLDADDGSLIWSYQIQCDTPLETSTSSPNVVDGRVYIGGIDGKVHCLDAEGNGDGTTDELWTKQMETYSVDAAPAIVDDRVYIGGSEHVFCLDAADGSILWSFNATDPSHIIDFESSPAVANGRVYIACRYLFGGAKFYCLDANDGSKIWDREISGVNFYSSQAFYNNKVYIGYSPITGRTTIHCLDAETGDNVWKYKETIGGMIQHSSPVVADGKVYVGSIIDAGNDDQFLGGRIYCVDAETGEYVWDYPTGNSAGVESSPSVYDGKLYVGTLDGKKSGKLLCFGDPVSRPDKPVIDGPTSGVVGTEYTYTASTTDPDGDDISYLFDWGTGTDSEWLGPFPPETDAVTTHIWMYRGNFKVRVQAKDTDGYVSEWSDPLSVSMPRNRATQTPFLNFLQNHPILFQLLQRLLNLL